MILSLPVTHMQATQSDSSDLAAAASQAERRQRSSEASSSQRDGLAEGLWGVSVCGGWCVCILLRLLVGLHA